MNNETELKAMGKVKRGDWKLVFCGGPADGKTMVEDYPMPRMNVMQPLAYGTPLAVTEYRCIQRDHDSQVADYLWVGEGQE